MTASCKKTGFRGFHRDNVDRTDLTAPDWDGDYTIVPLAIYLQDNKNYSGGLKIKNPSGKAVFVESEEGDVVTWNPRTMRSGNAGRFKFFKNIMINKAGREGIVPALLKKDHGRKSNTFYDFRIKIKTS